MSDGSTRAQATDWSAAQYLKFEDERTRPARDLLAQVPQRDFDRVVDIGCGPGNSTEILAERYPKAEIVGIDSSSDMLREARVRLPDRRFAQADVAAWMPPDGTGLLFANAVFQWVPNREAVMQRLLHALPEGGVLAVQMPDNLGEPSHLLMEETARKGPWARKLDRAQRAPVPTPEQYYDLLKPGCGRLDIWRTTYHHALDGAAAIVEWVKGTGLRPFVDPLDREEREAYLSAYTAAIAQSYPLRGDGKALLRFPRLFIVAVR